MASPARTVPDRLADPPDVTAALLREPHAFDFFDALRRIECAFPQKARLGQALRPAHEPLRLGQEPSMAFASSPLASLVPAQADKPARLLVHFFGLLGPSGPLPLHITEYVRDRARNANDPTLARFLDIFHHRLLSLFYRTWANSRPTVSFDRPSEDRFATYLGALCGLGTKPSLEGGPFSDLAGLHFAGRLAARPRNAEGLAAMLRALFELNVTVEPFVGEWLPLPAQDRWHLRGRHLGQDTVLGSRTYQRQSKFRLVFGPLDQDALKSLLPGGSRLGRLKALVNHYAGPALAWDLRLRPSPQIDMPLRLGRCARLGWTAWLGSSGRHRQDVIFDPGRIPHPHRPMTGQA